MRERAMNLQESAKRPWRLVRLTGFAVVGLVLAVLAGGMVFQRIGEIRAASLYPAPGELYDVGSVSLHMVCRGEGDQTVVLSSGMGNPASSWRPLWSLISGSAPMIGMGWAGAKTVVLPETLGLQVTGWPACWMLCRFQIPSS